jgi:hypothetical protein
MSTWLQEGLPGDAMTRYYFDQCLAEAIHRIGRDPVFRYLEGAARRVGWPIPHKHRPPIIRGLVLLVRAKKTRREAGITDITDHPEQRELYVREKTSIGGHD